MRASPLQLPGPVLSARATDDNGDQVVYYGAFAAVMLLMAWMVFESMTGEAPKRRQRATTRQSPVANEDPSPPGPDVLARVAIKTDEGGSQIFLDVKHQLDDLEGIQGDVDVFMAKWGVPPTYKEQLFNAAQDALKQQLAQQAGGASEVPANDNWADSHVAEDEEEDDSPEEVEVEE
ncbi:MAG: hypothetical protein ACPIOQ_70130 [Promethearchaeia archaeon]